METAPVRTLAGSAPTYRRWFHSRRQRSPNTFHPDQRRSFAGRCGADGQRPGVDAVVGFGQGGGPSHLGSISAAPEPCECARPPSAQRAVCGLVQPAGQAGALAAWRGGGDFFRRHGNRSQGPPVRGSTHQLRRGPGLELADALVGAWLLDGILDGAGDVSQRLPVLLDEHQQRWQGRPSYLYADSASSAGKFLNRIEPGAFSRWSVSYNKWTDLLDRLGAELADSQWSALPKADQPQEQYAWVKHQPGDGSR